MTMGADGTGMHSLHAGNAASVTIRLLKTSPRNAQLRAAYNLQKTSSALWGQNLITVSDIARGDTTTLRQVAFKKPAPINYAKDGGTMEWTFDAIIADVLLGGGSPSLF